MQVQIISFLAYFIQILSQLLFWAIFIWVLLSWFSAQKNGFGEILSQIVEPILKPFRWARIGMIDLSPIVAMFIINHGGQLLVRLLIQL